MAVSLGLARIYVTFIVTNPLKSLQISLFRTFLEVMERMTIEVTWGEGPLGVPPGSVHGLCTKFCLQLVKHLPTKAPP